MLRKFWQFPSFLFTVLILGACSASKKPVVTAPASNTGPSAEREFRAAWVATVANINWPSRPGLSTDSQKREAIVLLDFLAAHRFNAVIFQVRPHADALYASSLEPWSYYLTGEQGKAPAPYYDPLQFWIEAAHERGIELHAWLNPYRAHHPAGGTITDHSLTRKFPHLVMPLKEGYWWFDPSRREVQDHAVNVVMDLVKRYDLDGIHFDDYFYPYPSYNGTADFPDSMSYAAYIREGGSLSKGDWRRKSVNDLIERLYSNIRKTKSHVKFGLSPFGIWRPGNPPSIEGFDQYDQLYADAKLWLNEGWIDYMAPQLYWPINRIPQSYPVLLRWWIDENTQKRHLWPGIGVGRDTAKAVVNETLSQIMIDRGMNPDDKGVIHWSISSVTKNPALSKALVEGPYKREALVPSSAWMDNNPPAAPGARAEKLGESILVEWSHTDTTDVFRWVIYFRQGNRWDYKVVPKTFRSWHLSLSATAGKPSIPITEVRVSAVDRTGNESSQTVIKIQ